MSERINLRDPKNRRQIAALMADWPEDEVELALLDLKLFGKIYVNREGRYISYEKGQALESPEG